MPKQNIPEAIRQIVTGILKQQPAAKKEWRQQEHAAAVSKAALTFSIWYAALPPKTERDKDGVVLKPGRDGVTWKTFAEQYGACGFGGGNLSQFQQALDGLDAGDACYVKRPTRGSATTEYA